MFGFSGQPSKECNIRVRWAGTSEKSFDMSQLEVLFVINLFCPHIFNQDCIVLVVNLISDILKLRQSWMICLVMPLDQVKNSHCGVGVDALNLWGALRIFINRLKKYLALEYHPLCQLPLLLFLPLQLILPLPSLLLNR